MNNWFHYFDIQLYKQSCTYYTIQFPYLSTVLIIYLLMVEENYPKVWDV